METVLIFIITTYLQLIANWVEMLDPEEPQLTIAEVALQRFDVFISGIEDREKYVFPERQEVSSDDSEEEETLLAQERWCQYAMVWGEDGVQEHKKNKLRLKEH